MITAIRNGNIGASYHELSEEIIDDPENLLIVMDPERMADIPEGDMVPYEPTPKEINAARAEIRRFKYAKYADPFAFKMLRGQATEAEWDLARAEIMAAWPDVPEV